jgi:hypothetical protein
MSKLTPTEHEMYLIKAAFRDGAEIGDVTIPVKAWLDDVIDDGGNTLQQHLLHYARCADGSPDHLRRENERLRDIIDGPSKSGSVCYGCKERDDTITRLRAERNDASRFADKLTDKLSTSRAREAVMAETLEVILADEDLVHIHEPVAAALAASPEVVAVVDGYRRPWFDGDFEDGQVAVYRDPGHACAGHPPNLPDNKVGTPVSCYIVSREGD